MKNNILKIKYTDDFLLSLKENKEEFEEQFAGMIEKIC